MLAELLEWQLCQKCKYTSAKKSWTHCARPAAQSGRSVADLVREAIRKLVLTQPATGPVAISDGEAKRSAIEHDSVHDEP